MAMELRIGEITIPEVISFNFDELKQEITQRAEKYSTMLYTEEDIKQAKADRANLNKFIKALDDARKGVKKQVLAPYEEFADKITELQKIVEYPIGKIDETLKAHEDKRKREKMFAIQEFVNSIPDYPLELTFDKVFSEKMLNATVSMASIKEEILAKVEKFKADIETLQTVPGIHLFYAMAAYYKTLDITAAIKESNERKAEDERKALFEQKRKEQVPEEPAKEESKTLVNFSAYMTVSECRELKKWFDDRRIEFMPI